MTRFTVTTALAAALALAGCGSSKPTPEATSATSTSPTSAALAAAERDAPAATSLTRQQRAAINQQDHISPRQAQAERSATRSRPLLAHLPLSVGDATIAIGGLAADGRSVRITINAPGRSRAEALSLYHDALHAYGDSGAAYQPEVTQ